MMIYKAQIHVIPSYGDPYWMGTGKAYYETEEAAKDAALESVRLNEHFNIDKIRILSRPSDWDVITEEDVNHDK